MLRQWGLTLLLGGFMPGFSTYVTDIQAIPLPEIAGISSLSWTPQGLWLTADNVPGVYRWDPVQQKIQQQVGLHQPGPLKVMPKAQKPDFEASTLYNGELWLFGSGSTKERNSLVRLNLQTLVAHQSSLAELYQELTKRGLEVNIEGAALVQQHLLLANRGHMGYPYNHLIHIQNQQVAALQRLILPDQPFVGISALEYESEHDRLWFTASTEATSSVYDDGQIGDSYVGWIDGYTQLQQQPELKPTQCFNLTPVDGRFRGQKMEGIAVTPDHLFLGTDNDGGQTWLYMLKRKAPM